ncbi:MAG TPA: hypothetical protein VHQ86_01435, partial [Candidatus Saccharimonadia bacterium]|nr:hypothetical protein [Candidatus Saccharimonadia bacterium]
PSRRTLIIIALGLLAVLIAGLSLYAWLAHKSPATGEAQLHNVEAKIGKHYILPTDEVPALATVTDTSKLTTPFLKGTKNGDQVLIYQKNHIAIIYRPSVDRIVSVGPVTIDNPRPNSP